MFAQMLKCKSSKTQLPEKREGKTCKFISAAKLMMH